MTPEDALERGLAQMKLDLERGARAKLLDYVALLAKWNKTYNLTAIREPGAMVAHHLLDSLAAAPHLPLEPSGRLADVGSGGGMPGIALAIARPDVSVCLNDSSAKQAAFLRQAVMELGLANARVHEGRVEQWEPAQLFDIVVSRAFAELRAFVLACRHLVKRGGVLAAMKGARAEEELAAAADVCKHPALIHLDVPFLDASRSVVLCGA
jgi:16S rRNA (guanine527-N7)-methyltransferase